MKYLSRNNRHPADRVRNAALSLSCVPTQRLTRRRNVFAFIINHAFVRGLIFQKFICLSTWFVNIIALFTRETSAKTCCVWPQIFWDECELWVKKVGKYWFTTFVSQSIHSNLSQRPNPPPVIRQTSKDEP